MSRLHHIELVPRVPCFPPVSSPHCVVQVVLQRNEVTKPGQVHRIKGEGMPKLGNEKVKGDLIVTYHVSFPTKLTQEQKQTVRKLFV
jgi:DnaJ-class molecular chaperone